MPARIVDYDRIASDYDRRYQTRRYEGVDRALRAWLEARPRRRVLEVGCGTGHWLRRFGGCGGRIFGMDLSRGMLAKARVTAPGSPLVNGRALRLPFADHSFDAVFCVNALHHFPEKSAFVEETARVLIPGGDFCTVGLDPYFRPLRWMVYEYFEGTRETDEERYPAHEQIQACLRAAGFAESSASVVQHIQTRRPAQEALASPMLRRHGTSQLALLSDEAYRRGVQCIRAAMEREEAAGRALYLEEDLRLFATMGRMPD
jgi:ubiquinone/menaquinone biosynthesis C-methylase UbiE